MSQRIPPAIRKRGTFELSWCAENTLVMFGGRLYSFRWPEEHAEPCFHFVDCETGRTTPRFGHGYYHSQAFADGDTMYVTAVPGNTAAEKQTVYLFTSRDLVNWQRQVVLELPGWVVFTTPICRADGRYVMMLDVCSGPEEEIGVGFTCRFATSTNMTDWEMTPPECVYAKDRYTAGHFIRWLEGHFYNFYLEQHGGAARRFPGEQVSWDMRVVRSPDLVHWETSPFNPVLQASEEDRILARDDFTPAQLDRIATAVNINNGDMSFCEYEGRVIMHYAWGDQQTAPCCLAEAVYEGAEAEFLRAWFP